MSAGFPVLELAHYQSRPFYHLAHRGLVLVLCLVHLQLLHQRTLHRFCSFGVGPFAVTGCIHILIFDFGIDNK